MSEGQRDIESLMKRIAEEGTTARAVVESAVNAAEKLNEPLNAFLQIDRDGALKRAESLTNREGALAGIPVAIKDNICVQGMQASCGSHILGDYHPPYNATVIQRLL
ncbi:MAG TPA: amidase family protein, partial [Pyrinomonadaceae bacterium]|nr:amidase family protein [Pyrinomonadaceae bacterium]